jgi:hypothetical protein
MQQSLFEALRLSEPDRLYLAQTLDDFDQKFRALHDEDAADVSLHPYTDHAQFRKRRDLMMDNILASLKLHLSPSGFNALNQHVQSEKRNMRISPVLEGRP